MSELYRRLLDGWLEYRINLAARGDLTNPQNWKRFCALIQQRSARQVARWSAARGLPNEN